MGTATVAEYVELAYDEIEHETQNAWLIDFGDDEPQWVPISVINHEDFDPKEHTIEIAEWFATKEGLI